MGKPNFSAALPGITLDNIDLIAETYGLTKTQVFVLAIERLTADLHPERGNRQAMREAYRRAKNNKHANPVPK
jgi:hypothetical protein